MRLVIGGSHQGKLHYVKIKYGEELAVWNDFQDYVREHQSQEAFIRAELGSFLAENPDGVIISDEIGNGLVPIQQEDRDYRDLLGRLLCELAEEADSVERVICGLGQKLK